MILGSVGAHGLEAVLESRGDSAEHIAKRLDQFDVGVRYHLIHSVALLGLAGISIGSLSVKRWVARLLVAGLVLFSGSLYVLVFSDNGKLGMVAPFGGLSWIIAWLMMIWLAISRPTEPQRPTNG